MHCFWAITCVLAHDHVCTCVRHSRQTLAEDGKIDNLQAAEPALCPVRVSFRSALVWKMSSDLSAIIHAARREGSWPMWHSILCIPP